MSSRLQGIMATLFSVAAFLGLYLGLSWPILIAAALSIGVYAGVYLITRPKLKIGNIWLDSLKDGEEMRQLFLEAKDDVVAIGNAGKKVSNETIKQQSAQLYDTSNRILDYLEKNPNSISDARRFLNYYLNTARDILEKYLAFQKTDIKTDEIQKVTASTERAMTILNQAFNTQFTHLMENDIMDIEADIKLLETNLKMEGFK